MDDDVQAAGGKVTTDRAADVAAAAKAIAALGEAVLAGGESLREVEINPLLVMPQGKGAVAVDALVLLNEAANKMEKAA